MATMKKTLEGTIYAGSYGMNDDIHVDGIGMGIYGKENCIALEYDPEEGRLNLLLMDERIKACGIHIKHVDSEWKERRETRIYDSHGADSELNERTGSNCEIIRKLTEEEADPEVGPMFHIKFEDGFETDAFEDELIRKDVSYD